MVRGKFKVIKTAQLEHGAREVTLQPQYDQNIEEDRRFSRATPQFGTQITMVIDNPPAADYLALGKFFYVDFTEVPEAKPAT